MEADIWLPYFPYGVVVLSIGYHAEVAQALDWKTSHSLTYPVLSDRSGLVTIAYSNFGGEPVLPWDAIVSVPRVLCYNDRTYEVGNWEENLLEVIAIFDSLFEPQAAANPAMLDFGEVEVGSSSQLTLYLDNTGTGLLQFSAIQSSATAFSVLPTLGEIYAVDDSLEITVTFTPDQVGPYDEVLTVLSPTDTLEIPVLGIGTGVGVKSEEALPQEFGVFCYPNPFNAELNLRIQLVRALELEANLYDVNGVKQAQLWKGSMNSGDNFLRRSSGAVPSGMYFVEVRAQDWRLVEKVVLLK
ncbi:MAG: choice-of-anchor D domain-containing protein [bacterium]